MPAIYSVREKFGKPIEQAVFAMAITFPTVPRGQARHRVMISAAHEDAHLERGLEAFRKVGKALGVI